MVAGVVTKAASTSGTPQPTPNPSGQPSAYSTDSLRGYPKRPCEDECTVNLGNRGPVSVIDKARSTPHTVRD
jgi:hypothetical protein